MSSTGSWSQAPGGTRWERRQQGSARQVNNVSCGDSDLRQVTHSQDGGGEERELEEHVVRGFELQWVCSSEDCSIPGRAFIRFQRSGYHFSGIMHMSMPGTNVEPFNAIKHAVHRFSKHAGRRVCQESQLAADLWSDLAGTAVTLSVQ